VSGCAAGFTVTEAAPVSSGVETANAPWYGPVVSRTDDYQQFEGRPQSLLMTMFGAYLEPRTSPVWSGGLVSALEYFGATTGSSRIALVRLVQRGLATREKEGRHVYYRLTERGLHLLEDGDNRIFSLGQRAESNGAWTLVWHALPDTRKIERSQLVKQLRFHGFGQLQDGTWLSPRDYVPEVEELATKLGVSDAVAIFRTEPTGDVTRGPLIAHLWPLDEVAKRYRAFVAEYRPRSRRKLPDQQAFVTCTKMVHDFRAFAMVDPELPDAVATHAAARREAIAVFETVYGRLHDPAAAHFRTLTQR
jgi:phenylacetic acid degradation operon negative regulatory protein